MSRCAWFSYQCGMMEYSWCGIEKCSKNC